MQYDYNDIRYYNDEDLNKYLPFLAEEPTMYRIMRYFKPGISDEEIKRYLLGFKNIKDFQIGFIVHLVEKIIQDSTTSYTFDGIQNLDPKKKYVFITNHRNIVLDVAGLNYVLFKGLGDDFQSTAIAIGDNLLQIPWVQHLARLNKSFLVKRSLQPQQMLRSSIKLSNYIREIITSGQDCVWIAHREGRTKDGNDFSQAGLIKMLSMSAKGLFADNLAELHILPVVISYEKDPCVLMKIKELEIISKGEKYKKGPMEDFNSMFAGLMGQKGRVHYQFGQEITREQLLKMNENTPVNKKVRNFCNNLDKFIYSNYRLYESNYIAADILNESESFTHLYSHEQKQEFEKEMTEKMAELGGDNEFQRTTYLKMFAYPVRNYYSVVDNDYKFCF